MLRDIRNITKDRRWKGECELLFKQARFSKEFIEAFHTHWVESAHQIRSQVADDVCLIKLLRHIFPQYAGNSALLYRGESIDRFRVGSIGLCWTVSVEMARMFARGLNAVNSGGVLLSCVCDKDWIITGPNRHSKYLGEEEYIVDILKVTGIKATEKFKPLEIVR